MFQIVPTLARVLVYRLTFIGIPRRDLTEFCFYLLADLNAELQLHPAHNRRLFCPKVGSRKWTSRFDPR